MITPYIPVCLIFILVSVNALDASQLKSGDKFPQIQSTDQHEEQYSIPEGTQFVAVTFTMSAGKKANQYFSSKGKSFLPDNKAVYLANIHGMPSVARVFAMPKMRKYPHRIMLADEKDLLEPFPQKKGFATVFQLDDSNRIVSITFWDPESKENPF